MNVYFNCNFYGHRPYERAGKPITLDKSFTWNGYLYLVPAIYIFKEGFVIDMCKRIPMVEAGKFFSEWSEERRTSQLTTEELERMEQETPFDFGFSTEFSIHGHAPKNNRGSCFVAWHSLGSEAHYIEDVSEELMEAYGCDKSFAWFFSRTCVPWPGGRETDLKSLTMTLRPSKKAYTCDKHFVTSANTDPFTVDLRHPLSGDAYRLYVISTGQERLEDHTFDQLHCGREIAMDYPLCLMTMEYYIERADGQTGSDACGCVDGEEIRVFDCAQPERPVPRVSEASEDGCARDSSVSIIGGCDGPTSVFFAGKIVGVSNSDNAKRNCHPIQTAVSSLHFNPVEQVKWRVVFNITAGEPEKIVLL